jgi:hypothetical protein
MKIMSLFARKLFVGAVALAAVVMTSQALADTPPQVVTVVRVKGMARVSSDSKTWHPVKRGDVLNPGCVIQTGPKSLVDIQLGERDAATAAGSTSPTSTLYSPEQTKANIVRIFENSALGVDKLAVDKTGAGDEISDTQLDLKAGQILGNVKKLSSASKYEVKIPNGVAGIRGTVYLISSSGVVNVLTGSVVIAIVGPDGTVTTRVVNAHESYDPATNTVTRLTNDQVTALKKLVEELPPGPNNPGPIPGRPILFVSPNS